MSRTSVWLSNMSAVFSHVVLRDFNCYSIVLVTLGNNVDWEVSRPAQPCNRFGWQAPGEGRGFAGRMGMLVSVVGGGVVVAQEAALAGSAAGEDFGIESPVDVPALPFIRLVPSWRRWTTAIERSAFGGCSGSDQPRLASTKTIYASRGTRKHKVVRAIRLTAHRREDAPELGRCEAGKGTFRNSKTELHRHATAFRASTMRQEIR